MRKIPAAVNTFFACGGTLLIAALPPMARIRLSARITTAIPDESIKLTPEMAQAVAVAQAQLPATRSGAVTRSGVGTIDELLMAAEYIMSEGNDNVILCERGIRTFETRTRNTFDLNAVPVLHHLSHLPVVADPSHATGYTRYVEPMALAATACGANGLEIEVHDEPSRAWSDGAQALTPDQFDDTMRRIGAIREVVCEECME